MVALRLRSRQKPLSSRPRCELASGKFVSDCHLSFQDIGSDLDDVDRSIFYLLQQDARNSTAQEMADTVSVSASTIRNRINQLEDDGMIKGYHPEIEYEAANLPLQITFVLSAQPTELQDSSEQIRGIQGVSMFVKC